MGALASSDKGKTFFDSVGAAIEAFDQGCVQVKAISGSIATVKAFLDGDDGGAYIALSPFADFLGELRSMPTSISLLIRSKCLTSLMDVIMQMTTSTLTAFQQCSADSSVLLRSGIGNPLECTKSAKEVNECLGALMGDAPGVLGEVAEYFKSHSDGFQQLSKLMVALPAIIHYDVSADMSVEEARRVADASRCKKAGEGLLRLFDECQDNGASAASAYDELRGAIVGSNVTDTAGKALSRHAATCVHGLQSLLTEITTQVQHSEWQGLLAGLFQYVDEHLINDKDEFVEKVDMALNSALEATTVLNGDEVPLLSQTSSSYVFSPRPPPPRPSSSTSSSSSSSSSFSSSFLLVLPPRPPMLHAGPCCLLVLRLVPPPCPCSPLLVLLILVLHARPCRC